MRLSSLSTGHKFNIFNFIILALQKYVYLCEFETGPCEACVLLVIDAAHSDQLITAVCSFRLHMDLSHDGTG